MKKALSAISIAVRVLLILIVGILLVYNIYVMVAKLAFKQQMPVFLGFATAAVLSGSMEPAINTGDYIVTLEKDGYEVGDIVMYENGGSYTTHRIVEETEEGFRTMGDNNGGSVDPWIVHEEDIVGEVVLVLRGFGSVAAFFQTPLGMFIIVIAAALIWVLCDILSRRNKKDKKEESHEAEP